MHNHCLRNLSASTFHPLLRLHTKWSRVRRNRVFQQPVAESHRFDFDKLTYDDESGRQRCSLSLRFCFFHNPLLNLLLDFLLKFRNGIVLRFEQSSNGENEKGEKNAFHKSNGKDSHAKWVMQIEAVS